MKALNKVLLLAVVAGGANVVQAQTQSLDALLQEVKNASARAAQVDAERKRIFEQDRNQQRALVADVKQKVASAEARGAALKTAFEDNEKTITELNESLDIQLGDLKELFGIVRQQASDVKGVIETSLVSAQHGDRLELVTRLAAAKKLPSIDDLSALRLLMQEEMTEEAKIVRFPATIADSAGTPYESEVVRVGVFNLITGDKFLNFDPDTKVIQELGRQPQSRYRSDAAGLFDAQSGVHRMSIDPTYGGLLSQLVKTPNTKERVDQGGPVGYIILSLGLIGLLVAIWRLIFLTGVQSGVSKQLKSKEPSTNNALGRILSVYSENKEVDTETLELKLDEAILKETPRLEKWQGTIKIIAAVAPLLGLLGTVVGMIETFQNITLYGTGDPKLMASGISKALVTTMLGLIVAIPMVLLHSWVASRSKGLIEVLEEQSAGIIAKQSEREL